MVDVDSREDRLSRSRQRFPIFWIALLFALIPARGWSQPASETDGAYRAAVTQGVEHFDAEKYSEARDAFRQAYTLRSEPALLFSIASTYRREGNRAQAIATYERFLQLVPATHPKRAVAESIIADLRAESSFSPDVGDPPPFAPGSGRRVSPAGRRAGPGAGLPLTSTEPASDPSGQRASGRQWVGWTWGTGIAGIAAASVGTFVYVRAHSTANRLESRGAELAACADENPLGGEACQWTRGELDDAGGVSRNRKIGTALWVGGGTLLVTSGLLYWLGRPDVESAPTVSIAGDGEFAVGYRLRY